MAIMATKHHHDALDIVQNSMISLVRSYSGKPRDEWRPLFYRILQNEIKTWAGKQSLFKKWFSTQDPEPQLDHATSASNETPEGDLARNQISKELLATLRDLPLKQQQCFLLRSWEGLSVKETAIAMACSEGTVKAHMSRASEKLRNIVEGAHYE